MEFYYSRRRGHFDYTRAKTEDVCIHRSGKSARGGRSQFGVPLCFDDKCFCTKQVAILGSGYLVSDAILQFGNIRGAIGCSPLTIQPLPDFRAYCHSLTLHMQIQSYQSCIGVQ
jgi:hypothetical protein